MISIYEPAYGIAQGYIRRLYALSIDSDPATRASVVFSAASHLRLHKEQLCHPASLLELRGYALGSIQDVIKDPNRVFNDATVAVVGTIRIGELLYGHAGDHDVHKRGLSQLRKLRQGSISPCLDRTISWFEDMQLPHIISWSSSRYHDPPYHQ